ncbi:hypothetical protein E5Q_02005 [Mixia osmundae IAM 14324]|uniref:ESCRT-II complex subunit VPS25 n=1 Tax=Mixia osmundae (strain CBS 9802 / IAM 14324 / JCM 22182 / KY 12970) TaxID=764103 RepID=G7DXN8_MIXOS|nr:hypothetical protein E5Q_02005 [Mixia osmundae IAM 14324]
MTASASQLPVRKSAIDSSFAFPGIFSFPPFFTLQPHEATRDAQLLQWKDLIIAYARHFRLFELELSLTASRNGELWTNPACATGQQRRVTPELQQAIISYLISQDLASYPVEGSLVQPVKSAIAHDRLLIYTRTPAEWATVIYDFITRNGLNGSIMTAYELVKGGDLAHTTEFYEMPVPLLRLAMTVLVKQGKAQIFKGTDDPDVALIFTPGSARPATVVDTTMHPTTPIGDIGLPGRQASFTLVLAVVFGAAALNASPVITSTDTFSLSPKDVLDLSRIGPEETRQGFSDHISLVEKITGKSYSSLSYDPGYYAQQYNFNFSYDCHCLASEEAMSVKKPGHFGVALTHTGHKTITSWTAYAHLHSAKVYLNADDFVIIQITDKEVPREKGYGQCCTFYKKYWFVVRTYYHAWSRYDEIAELDCWPDTGAENVDSCNRDIMDKLDNPHLRNGCTCLHSVFLEQDIAPQPLPPDVPPPDPYDDEPWGPQ